MVKLLLKFAVGLLLASCLEGIMAKTALAQYIITLPDGTRCEGQFSGYNGNGICKYPNGYYRGTIRNGVREGQGIFYYEDPAVPEIDQGGDDVGYDPLDAFRTFLVTGAVSNIYEGQFRNGQPNGRGKFVYKNDDRYEGEVRDGLPHGTGLFIFRCSTRGDVGDVGDVGCEEDEYRGYPNRYYGSVQFGLPNGRGSMVYENCNRYRYRNETLLRCDRYDGQFRNGLFHGQGTLTYAECAVLGGQFRCKRFTGQFFEGEPNGPGTLVYTNNDRCEGTFDDIGLNGRGSCFFSNGDRYTGELRQGRPHGVGRMTFADGRVFNGEFRFGEPFNPL